MAKRQRHGNLARNHSWRSKYGGLEVSEMRRLRQLEEENRRLKSIVADQALDIRVLKDVTGKKRLQPAVKRQMVVEVVTTRSVAASRLRADRDHATRVKRAPVQDRNRRLRQRLRELAEQRRR